MARTKFTKAEISWILYDVGNSAFTMLACSLIPIWFKDLAIGTGPGQITGDQATAYYAIAISVDDCTGCGNCVDVCLAKEKALSMAPYMDHEADQAAFDFLNAKVGYKTPLDPKSNLKAAQFSQPLF